MIYRLSIICSINLQNSDLATKRGHWKCKVLSKKMQSWVKEAQILHGQKARKGFCSHFPVKCEFSFPWINRTKFYSFSDIDNIFDNLTKQFFNIDRIVNFLKILNLSAFDNFFPIYRWPISDSVKVSTSRNSVDPLIAHSLMNMTMIIWSTDHTFLMKNHQNPQ